ncbi:MAG TPA: sugar ABC transporter substrate-binding protein [Firmicutes bacterium]|nr:sugar ABC transporter substrate-binding protein [Bacillota bacterium]
MKTMKKLTSLLLVTTLILLFTGYAAIGNAAPKPKAKELYGMVVFLKGSEFFNWCYAGFRDAAATVGPNIVTELQGPAEWDAAGEARAVEQLVAKKAKGIAVTAGNADTLVASINTAIKMKVPTLCFDSDSPKSKRLLFIGPDNFNAGFAAGKAIGEKLGNKARVGITGIPGLDAIKGRVKGFEAGLASVAPEAKVVATVNDEGDLNKAESVNTAMLQAHPEINAIFCAHGVPATGAVKATVNVGRNSGDSKVLVCGYANDVSVMEMIERGELACSVVQDPYLTGVVSFWNLYAAAHPGQFKNMNYPEFGDTPSANIDTGVKVIFKGDPLVKVFKSSPKIR